MTAPTLMLFLNKWTVSLMRSFVRDGTRRRTRCQNNCTKSVKQVDILNFLNAVHIDH